MYQYQDPPEVQSQEQRSVVFAVLACFVASLYSIWPTDIGPEYYARAHSSLLPRITIPVLISFIILFCGDLWKPWPKFRRVSALFLVAGFLVLAEAVFFYCTGITSLIAFAKIWQVDVDDWNYFYH